ncbi:hypothetical protein [Streptomyces sp. SID5910]|uniref:hypothetical protein n=1 Tax=Streptomyces sp. SID5910 TaxID=2690312 RepID=UPI001369D724|nr:hypothetical protein [Streptomyces sp. SID5910]MYR45264.1 hypothetical protein [Streptomyces sp. SID5910]
MRVRTFVRGLLAAGSAFSAAAVLAVGAPVQAHASATGSTALGTFDYDLRGAGVRVPVGCFLTHTVKGSGKRITSQFAGIDCVGLASTFSHFCNWRIDFGYADTNNRTYRTSRGATHTECKGDPLREVPPQTLPKYGKTCAKFYVNGKLRAVQCHYVTK